jgi:solute carrier family 25 oxoglutarate transporter 11
VTTAVPVKPKSWLDIVQPFVIGGLSGCLATSIIQPIDMIKVTIQLKSEEISAAKKAGIPITSDVSPMSAIRDIYASGGIRAFYKGYLT